MNPALLWSSIGSGVVLLVSVLVARRSGASRSDVPRSALEGVVGLVGAFLLLIGAALLAPAATRVLVVWLVVLLTVAVVVTLLRLRPATSDAAHGVVPDRAEALTAATRLLDRADYLQESVVRVSVSVVDADRLATAFGSGAVEAAQAVLARALIGVFPPDAPVWTEHRDRVVALVRQDECDLTAWRAEVEMAIVAASADADSVPSVPSAAWRTTSTDDRGYRLDDLEADEDR